MNKQLRILIAEDSEIDVKLLLRTLRAGGIDPVYETVETAESMQAALDAKPWDIVLSDYTMPQFDALAVLKIARRKDADLPVIIISGTIGEDVAVEAMRAGASDYFMKGHLVLLIPAIERELRDSAERRAHTQAEAALIESEAKYKTLYESARDALMTLFPPDWKFTSGNPATVGLFGAKDEADFASRAPWEVSPEYQPDGELSSVKAKRMIGMAMEKGSHFFEWTHKKIGGPDFPATVLLTRTALGGKTGLQATVRDVSAQKRAEAGVRGTYEMQGMLNAMLKRSLENVPLRDKLNSHLAALLAAPWLSVEAKGAVFLTGPGGRELVLTAHQALSPALLVVCAKVPFGRCLCGVAAATGQPAVSRSVEPDHHITYKGITPHGHYCAPIMAGGKVLGVLNLYLKEGGALTESQERFVKAAADVIAGNIIHSQVEDEFMQAQKIEAVGLLAGGVAHDFNNILTAIISYAEFVRRALPPGDPKAADMQEILTAADRAAALTRQLLAFGRRQIMAPQVVDLNRVVGGMTKLLSRLIGEDIKLTTKLAPAPCLVLVDPGQIEQVIMNLAVNARDAMPEGGAITLETEILPLDEGTPPDIQRGPLACLSVRDAGCGMTAEVKSRIFEPFFTTKELGKGTGLGLSTVFGIIKQSGGEIEVESEPGKGTTFVIYLPLREACLRGKDKDKDKNKAAPAKGRETVLFVEDEETLRRLGARILVSGGYTVLMAANGAEALKVLERHGKPVDLLLTDVIMPGMDGRELAFEVARRKLVKRVLYMSGYTDDAIVKHGVLEHGISFIYKPFTVDAVLLKLREVLDNPADQAKA